MGKTVLVVIALVVAALALGVSLSGGVRGPDDGDAVAAVGVAGGQDVQIGVDADIGDVVSEVETLNALRSSLAKSFAGEPDQETFARVCKPVGARAKRIASENGWKIAQLAERYRNPEHKLDYEALRVFKMMEDDRTLMGIWVRTDMDGETGVRYFRRITVEPACLACHGARAGRPQFVKDGYPDDRAYGFEVGDLRGLYSVFVAD
jgi:hypothetical protein